MRLKEWRRTPWREAPYRLNEWGSDETGMMEAVGDREDRRKKATSRDLTGDIDSCFQMFPGLDLDSACCLDNSERK